MSVFKKREKEKLGLVGLKEAGSAKKHASNKIEQHSYEVGRIVAEENSFCFKETVGGKLCFFFKLKQAPMSQF